TAGGRIYWIFPSGYENNVLGPFVNRNQFAAWVELLLPIALYLAATERRGRGLFGCAAVVLTGSLVAAASRAGLVLGAAEIVVVGCLLARRSVLSRRAVVQFLLLIAVASAVVGWQATVSRWQFAEIDAIRIDAVRASWHMVRDRPWTGSGLGT